MSEITLSDCVSIGNQTARAAVSPMMPYRFALTHQFTAFEWFSDRNGEHGFDFDLFTDAHCAALRQEAAARGIRFSVHAPWDADPWQEGNNKELRRSIRFAAAINAPVVVMHLNPDAPLDAFVEALMPAAQLACRLSVRLALENTVYTPPEAFNRLFMDLDIPADVRPVLGMCLDVGHANLYPPLRNDYIAYVDRLDTRVPIIHLHLHENLGDADSHLTLFTGPAGEDDTGIRALLRRLAARRFKGSIILEQWPHPPELLVAARDRLTEMLGKLTPTRERM